MADFLCMLGILVIIFAFLYSVCTPGGTGKESTARNSGRGGMDDSGKLWFWEHDDGSLSIEWISKDVRWGLTFEKDLSESGWYYITRDNVQGDTLPAGLVRALKRHLITAENDLP